MMKSMKFIQKMMKRRRKLRINIMNQKKKTEIVIRKIVKKKRMKKKRIIMKIIIIKICRDIRIMEISINQQTQLLNTIKNNLLIIILQILLG